MTPGELAAALVEGLPRESPAISDSIDSLFLLPPVPNWFFQRDPAIVIGDRVVRASMATRARLREPLLSGAIFSRHPRFAREGGPFWFGEFSATWGPQVSWARMRPTLEGGDVLVLREDLLAIGYSERTERTTIERLAEALKRKKSPVQRIIVVGIPPERAYMHLDTVFTMVSADEALCYAPMILPGGPEEADVYEADLTKREISWTAAGDLLSVLRARKLDLGPIPCGGDVQEGMSMMGGMGPGPMAGMGMGGMRGMGPMGAASAPMDMATRQQMMEKRMEMMQSMTQMMMDRMGPPAAKP